MIDTRHNHRFPSPELKAEAERRAMEEGRTLTAHINELVKQDARKHPAPPRKK